MGALGISLDLLNGSYTVPGDNDSTPFRLLGVRGSEAAGLRHAVKASAARSESRGFRDLNLFQVQKWSFALE